MSKFNWKDCKETWYPDPNLRAYTCEKLISMGNPIRRLQAWQEEQVCDIQIIKSYIRSVNRSRNPFVCNVSKKWRQQSKGGRSIYDRTVASFRKNLLGSVWLAGLICVCMGWWPGTRVSYTSLSSASRTLEAYGHGVNLGTRYFECINDDIIMLRLLIGHTARITLRIQRKL